METNTNLSNKSLKPGAWFALSLAAAGISSISPLGWIIFPALMGYAMLRLRPQAVALPLALVGIISYALTGDLLGTALMLAVGLLSALAIYFLQTQKMGNANTALVLSGIGLIGLYLLTTLPGMLAGEGAFDRVQASVDAVVEGFRQVISATPGLPEEMRSAYDEYLRQVSQSATGLVVPLLCAVSGVYGLSNFLFFRLFARFGGKERLLPMRPFREWSIPKSMAGGLFLLLIGSMVLSCRGWSYGDSFATTVNVLVAMPLILQGLCTVDFFIYKNGKNISGRRVAVYVIAGLFFFVTQMPLMLIGCFEQVFQYRTRQATLSQ